MTSRTPWFSETGVGEELLLLHPGGTDSTATAPLSAQLPDYRRLLVDRPGHGRSPDVDGAWSFTQMAEAVAQVLETHTTPAHIVGWSDGAIVGLHLALRRPELVRSLVFGGAAFHRSGWLDGVLEGEPPEFMREAYAAISPDGGQHWPVVVQKAQQLHHREPDLSTQDLLRLRLPVLIVVGDDDQVRWPHLIEMLEALPDGELAVIPRATHGAIVEKPGLLAPLIREFHQPEPENGLAPIRRHG
ncbi:alpha/beta fold hydrolase [Nesterenkonia aurantiaca]|uniref:Pimeloyl-ACP methyl ester carboxylesterase n=1 Tax=Nesterenkonia aurantiaca TaxID=1436010 RepID=A0A4R7G6E1_9MICC|nr:alpha/beta hydrolase [Nesterenkonia aurantiaca]TDS86907.1 pimeloyl-ACP methyl ester carboxylesterase [Nesterenkonia aurantiaca]